MIFDAKKNEENFDNIQKNFSENIEPTMGFSELLNMEDDTGGSAAKAEGHRRI